MSIRWKVGIGIGLLALAACGEKRPDGRGSNAGAQDVAVAELVRFQAEENARSRVTMVDAATADATGMPPDWSGPDLETREGEKHAADAKRARGSAAQGTEPSAVQQDEFPSVAE